MFAYFFGGGRGGEDDVSLIVWEIRGWRGLKWFFEA